MSGPTAIVEYSEKDLGWWVVWGKETLYDEKRHIRTFPDPEAAAGFMAEHYPTVAVTIQLDDASGKENEDAEIRRIGTRVSESRQQDAGQRRLF